MSPIAKWEYMKTIHSRYHKTEGRKEKGVILDEFCKTYRCHRKHAIRLLNGAPPPVARPKRRSQGSPYRGGRVPLLLEAVWDASGRLCGQRLKPAIPLWLQAIRKRFKTTADEEQLLLNISSASIDRLLRDHKDRVRKKIYGTTRHGLLLKHHIPIKTDSWDVASPGFMEVDLVSHSGDCAEGRFAYTLNMTDIVTGWVERRCIPSKRQEDVRRKIEDIRLQLPFPLLGIDSDNGSEFINDHLWKYCQENPPIQFTRGRPYKKDDNAHIEQKNWTHVRKLMGYGRYAGDEAVAAMNDLYEAELRWMQNLFQPSMRLVRKMRIGSRLRRKYDPAQAPLDRLIASGQGEPLKVAWLRHLREELDPFALSTIVEQKLTKIWAMRTQARRPFWLKRGRIDEFKSMLEVQETSDFPKARRGTEEYEKIYARDVGLQTW